MPRGMHVHLLDFNEHVHSEDSMPRGVHMHFQKAHVSFPKKKSLEKKEGKFKEMTKTRSNEDVFEI